MKLSDLQPEQRLTVLFGREEADLTLEEAAEYRYLSGCARPEPVSSFSTVEGDRSFVVVRNSWRTVAVFVPVRDRRKVVGLCRLDKCDWPESVRQEFLPGLDQEA